MERKLQITGRGTLAISPDMVVLAFAVKVHEWEYEKTINRLNDKVEQLRKLLDKENLDRKQLKTKDFSVNRDTNYNKKTENYEFNGFKASHNLELELPLDQNLLNSLLSKIAGNLDDLNFQINFGVKDPAPHQQQLLKKAIAKAKENAALIAEASGVQLREIIDIDCSVREIQIRSRSYEHRLYSTDEAVYEASAPDFEPDDIDVAESITITWRIE